MPAASRRSSPGGAAAPRAGGRLRRVARFGWRWGLRPLLLLVALALAISWGGKGYQAVRASRMSPAERLGEDLQRLERILLLVHPAPFRNGGESEVRGALERAAAAVERLARGELGEEGVVAHFYEAVARLRDPHTYLRPRHATFGILRIGFGIFGDEVRVVAADDPAVLGARVIAFEEMPAAEALDAVRRLVGCPNESCFRAMAPGILRTPGLLHHLGVAADPSRLRLRVAGAGGAAPRLGHELEHELELELELERVTPDEFDQRPPDAIALEDDRLPRYRRSGRGPYWFEALPERQALYFRYEFATDASEEPLAELARRALREREALGTGPMIVDLRGNPGGDPHSHIPLVAALAASPATRGPGNLRVLVDRDTFSAAVVAASDLERRAGALLVGEEPGDLARLTTDARPFTLRHSGVEIWVPTGLMRTPGGAGGRSRLVPVRRCQPTFEEWLAGRDPALEAALEPVAAAGPYPAASGPQAGVPPSTPTPELAALPIGRFAFDAQRALVLSEEADGYRATVTGLGSDLLAPAAEPPAAGNAWAGGIQFGLRADAGGGLRQRLPDGAWLALPELAAPAPLELALAGRMAEASAAYDQLTAGGTDRARVASLGLVAEAFYRYEAGESRQGQALFELAEQLSPADALIPLQHSLLRREAEERWMPPVDELFRAVAACWRQYREAELANDYRLCL